MQHTSLFLIKLTFASISVQVDGVCLIGDDFVRQLGCSWPGPVLPQWQCHTTRMD